jgi:hypothetical protein
MTLLNVYTLHNSEINLIGTHKLHTPKCYMNLYRQMYGFNCLFFKSTQSELKTYSRGSFV